MYAGLMLVEARMADVVFAATAIEKAQLRREEALTSDRLQLVRLLREGLMPDRFTGR